VDGKKPNVTLSEEQKVSDSLKQMQITEQDSVIEDSSKSEAYKIGKSLGMQASSLKSAKTLEEYDSIQNSLPKNKRDGWFRGFIRRRVVKAREESHKDPEFEAHIYEKALHSTPKIFFLLLPFFAFLLWLVNNKKRFYYIDNLIFSLHFHSFWFLMLIIVILLSKLGSSLEIGDLLFLLFSLGIGVYLIMAMKKVYGSTWLKTTLKQIFIFFLYLFGFLAASVIILVTTFLMTYS
jgi:hypothetical protein